MWSSGRLVIVTGLTLAVALGCEASTSDAFTIPDGEEGAVCTPADDRGRATVGADCITNTSDEVVTVIDVRLVEPRGLSVGKWTLELAGTEVTGAASGWVSMSGQWSEGRVGPGETRHLVLGLQRDAEIPSRNGVASAAEIDYQTADGTEGSLITAFEVAVTPGVATPCG